MHSSTFEFCKFLAKWKFLGFSRYGNCRYRISKKNFFQLLSVVFDTWGKLPSGILSGSVVDVGDFDQCLKIDRKTSSAISSFTSQYCFTSVTFVTPVRAGNLSNVGDFVQQLILQQNNNLTVKQINQLR